MNLAVSSASSNFKLVLAVGNFNTYDYAVLAGVTGISFPIGWVSGGLVLVHSHSPFTKAALTPGEQA